jgi:hypothetical protein
MLVYVKQSLMLLKVQYVPNVVWKLIDLKVFNQCDKFELQLIDKLDLFHL